MCPQRRTPRPRHPIVGVCRRGGLRCGHLTAPDRDLTAPDRILTAPNRILTAPDRILTAPDRILTATKRGELHQ